MLERMQTRGAGGFLLQSICDYAYPVSVPLFPHHFMFLPGYCNANDCSREPLYLYIQTIFVVFCFACNFQRRLSVSTELQHTKVFEVLCRRLYYSFSTFSHL